MKHVLFSILMLALSPQLMAADTLKGTRPNIILMLSDDTGWGEVAASGNPIIKTPNMDRMYHEGVRLMNFHVAPSCAPTRAQIMTGIHNFHVGVTGTRMPEMNLHLDSITIAQVLKQAGYATGIFGKWHLGYQREYMPEHRGFDLAVDVYGKYSSHFDPRLIHNGVNDAKPTLGYRTDILFNEAMQWIAQQHEQKRPFFCYLPTYNAHAALDVEKKYSDPYEGKGLLEVPGFNNKGIMRGAVYYGMHSNLDYNIGRMIEFVEEHGLVDNTLLIYASDNGHGLAGGGKTGLDSKGFLREGGLYNAGMRGGKGHPWRGGTCVPCFLYWPGRMKAGVEVRRVTSAMDMFPTFAELAGASYEHEIEGRSLMPLIESPEADVPDRWLVVHTGLQLEKLEQARYSCAIQTDRYRMVACKELYDHLTDPGERHDIAGQHPEFMQELNAFYEQWWETSRPLMIGEIGQKYLEDVKAKEQAKKSDGKASE